MSGRLTVLPVTLKGVGAAEGMQDQGSTGFAFRISSHILYN